MRMNTIMHSTGRVEHRNVDWKPKKRYNMLSVEPGSFKASPFNFSLGFVKRQEEMQRVQRDNQVLS